MELALGAAVHAATAPEITATLPAALLSSPPAVGESSEDPPAVLVSPMVRDIVSALPLEWWSSVHTNRLAEDETPDEALTDAPGPAASPTIPASTDRQQDSERAEAAISELRAGSACELTVVTPEVSMEPRLRSPVPRSPVLSTSLRRQREAGPEPAGLQGLLHSDSAGMAAARRMADVAQRLAEKRGSDSGGDGSGLSPSQRASSLGPLDPSVSDLIRRFENKLFEDESSGTAGATAGSLCLFCCAS